LLVFFTNKRTHVEHYSLYQSQCFKKLQRFYKAYLSGSNLTR
jgi:hypothetical protein